MKPLLVDLIRQHKDLCGCHPDFSAILGKMGLELETYLKGDRIPEEVLASLIMCYRKVFGLNTSDHDGAEHQQGNNNNRWGEGFRCTNIECSQVIALTSEDQLVLERIECPSCGEVAEHYHNPLDVRRSILSLIATYNRPIISVLLETGTSKVSGFIWGSIVKVRNIGLPILALSHRTYAPWEQQERANATARRVQMSLHVPAAPMEHLVLDCDLQ